MRRREFLALSAAASVAGAQQQQPAVVASATVDTTPRVGIVLSSFKGGEEHDGTPLKGLDHPRPADADLTGAELDAMVRRAIELAALRNGNLATAVEADAWVVVKTHIPSCYGLPGASQPYIPGSVTDPRIVKSLISYLAGQKRGLRFTVVEGSAGWQPAERSGQPVDGWNTDWGGAFDGLSYRKMIADLAARFPGVRFEIVDLNYAESIELPVPGKALAHNNSTGTYRIPKVIQQCDRLISIAPLKTDPAAGVALTIANYLGIAPGSRYGFPKNDLMKLGSADEVMVDLLSYHPADFAIAGGLWALEGTASVHHNLVVAGARPVCVDAVASAAMGFEPAGLPFLRLAERKGFGTREVDAIWTRGNEIEEALHRFQRPPGWQPQAEKR